MVLIIALGILLSWLVCALVLNHYFSKNGFFGQRPRLFFSVFYGATISLFVVWVTASVFIPAIASGGNWLELQLVFERWQSVNMGILAITASMIAITSAHIREAIDRNRSKIAAQSALPRAASELSEYISKSIQYLDAAAIVVESGSYKIEGFGKAIPIRPTEYYDVFQRNYKYGAETLVGQLSLIETSMQVHTSRMNGLGRSLTRDDQTVVTMLNIADYLRQAAGIGARVNRLFEYGRNGAEIRKDPFKVDDLATVLRLNDVEIDDIEHLRSLLPPMADRLNRDNPYAPVDSAEPTSD